MSSCDEPFLVSSGDEVEEIDVSDLKWTRPNSQTQSNNNAYKNHTDEVEYMSDEELYWNNYYGVGRTDHSKYGDDVEDYFVDVRGQGSVDYVSEDDIEDTSTKYIQNHASKTKTTVANNQHKNYLASKISSVKPNTTRPAQPAQDSMNKITYTDTHQPRKMHTFLTFAAKKAEPIQERKYKLPVKRKLKSGDVSVEVKKNQLEEDRQLLNRIREAQAKELAQEKERERQRAERAATRVTQVFQAPYVPDRAKLLNEKRKQLQEKEDNRGRVRQIYHFVLSLNPNDIKEINQDILKDTREAIPIRLYVALLELTNSKNTVQYGNLFQRHIFEECRVYAEKAITEYEGEEEKVVFKGGEMKDDFLDVVFQFENENRKHRDKEKYPGYFSNDLIFAQTKSKETVFGIILGNSKDAATKYKSPPSMLLTVRFLKSKLSTSSLASESIWAIRKATSISTIIKANSAVHSLSNLSEATSKTIMDPSSKTSKYVDGRKLLSETLNTSTRFKNAILKEFNDSQIDAIANAVHREHDFTLIQGPPGTGKTSTICGILSCILRNNRKLTEDKKKRVLVCAPSNAAVDEIMIRLQKDGLIDTEGYRFIPVMTRMGVLNRVHPDIAGLYLDNIVKGKLNQKKEDQQKNTQEENNTAEEQVEMWDKRIEKLRLAIKTAEEKGQIYGHLENELADAERKFQNSIRMMRDVEKKHKKDEKIIYDSQTEIKYNILKSCDIICCTLGSIGNINMPNISNIIIDEACQSVEPESIIPIVFNPSCTSYVLVGDPQQLPATVLSKFSTEHNYTQSLMERMLKANFPKIMLDVQYRMHPEISYFPSAQFYSSRLGNGRNTIVAGTELRSSFQAQHQLFTVEPYRVFDISYGSHSHVKNSLMNQAEVDFIVNLCNFLFEGDKNALLSGNIGIVSPYRQQIAAIKSEMVNRFGHGVLDAVEISTVDGFQGREKDIVIMSCVRASSSTNKSDGIGFLNDVRRMNVGITRARACMFIVCDSDHLQKNEVWRNLIDNAKERKCYTRVQSPPPATRTFRPALPQLKPAPVIAPPPIESKRVEPRKEVVKTAPVKRKLDQPRLEDTKRQKTEQRKTQMIDIPSSKFKK